MKIGIAAIVQSQGTMGMKVIKLLDHLLGQAIVFFLPRFISENVLPITEVLIIRPGGMGDAVFLLPILRDLSKKGIAVDILCERRNAEVFSLQPDLVRKIYKYDQGLDLVAVFRKSYSAVIDTEQWHFFSGIVAYCVKSPIKCGFASRKMRDKLFSHAAFYGINEYELKNFQRLFEILGVHSTLELDGSLTLKEQKPSTNSLSFFIGASIPARRLNKDQIITIIHRSLKKYDQIYFLGGSDVRRLADEILMVVQDPRIKDCVGKLSLQQTAEIIAQSKQFLGVDSGLMHLACALGVPVTAIFGPGNKAKWSPQGSRHTVIDLNLACSPCTHFGYTVVTCGGEIMCMKNLAVDFV